MQPARQVARQLQQHGLQQLSIVPLK